MSVAILGPRSMPKTGIEYHVYGSHLFHTSSEEVWRYVTRFSEFTDYRHRVFTVHRDQVYSMPINLGTMSAYFRRHLTPDQARELIQAEIKREGITAPANLGRKGNFAYRPIPLRGLYQGLYRKAVANRSPTTAKLDYHSPAGPHDLQ